MSKKEDQLKLFKRRKIREIEERYPKQLAVGTEVEMEHTKDPEIAKIIALGHIIEDSKYYTKLIRAGLVDEEKAMKEAKTQGLILQKARTRKAEYTDSLGRKWKWDIGKQKYVYQRKDPSSSPRKERPTSFKIKEEVVKDTNVDLVIDLLGKGYYMKYSPEEISLVKLNEDKSKTKIFYISEKLFSKIPPKSLRKVGGFGTVSAPQIYTLSKKGK